MKFTNSTKAPTVFMRALIRWVIQESFPTNPTSVSRINRVYIEHTSIHHDPVVEFPRLRYGRDHLQVRVRLPRAAVSGITSDEGAFDLVCRAAAGMCPADIPQGELGLYRQRVAVKFLNHQQDLLSKWRSLIVFEDPLAGQKEKIERIKRLVGRWVRNKKLADTKLKIWNRRLKAAEKVLGKRIANKN